MDKKVFNANKKIEEETYKIRLKEYKSCKNKSSLIDKYKNHNMRFCLIINRDIAIENNDIEYANFITSVIDSMTNEISLLNKAAENNTINMVLNNYKFHEKVDIIFYVRKDFYDKEYEPYEVLNVKTYNILSQSIIQQANNILGNYGLKLKDIENMNIQDLYKLLNDEDLVLDILFASELYN